MRFRALACWLTSMWAVPACVPARAADAPLIVPTRDVDVTYDMAGRDNAGQPRTLAERVRWAPALGLMRVDPPTQGMYVVVQTKLHHLLLVRDDARAVLLMEADQASMAPGLEHADQFERAGSATVAGLACTEWHTRDSGGHPTTVCLTADGVLLRARSGELVLVQARAVSYAPLDATVFQVPPEYRTVRPPR